MQDIVDTLISMAEEQGRVLQHAPVPKVKPCQYFFWYGYRIEIHHVGMPAYCTAEVDGRAIGNPPTVFGSRKLALLAAKAYIRTQPEKHA